VSAIDLIKLAILAPLFLVAAPTLGLVLKGKVVWQRAAFAVMCFMTLNGLFGPADWGLTLGSIETYRGHTKGYHFYFNHALAIALIVAKFMEDPRRFRLLPPGLGWYVLYCLVIMAAHKMLFASVIFLATFHVLQTEDDLAFFVRVMVATMSWEMLVVLKSKYLDGIYQVRGTFEHQNPLAMYAVMIGMVFLATALGPVFRGSRAAFWGFLACGIIVQAALSRAALAMFAAGAISVTGLSLLEKPTARRVGTAAALGILGFLGLVLTIDTIVSRFHDKGNTASGELREVMNEASREMVRDYALGIGWNNFALVVNPPFRYAEIYYDWARGRGMRVDESKPNSVVESHYYLLLGENGYPGLISYLILILVGLWRNARAFVHFGHSFVRCLSLGIAAGCGLNYVQSTLERVLVQPRNLMLWLILLAITSRIEVLRRHARANPPQNSPPPP
jgi:hypothetical protein